MKKIKLLQRPVGALAVAVFVVLGGAGVYAAANWFGGNVQVTSTDDSIITVDLSKCESALPPGVEPGGQLDKVKFKVVGAPHISASELERSLLTSCEFHHARDIYRASIGSQIGVRPALIKQVDAPNGNVTLAFTWGSQSHEKTFTLVPGAKMFDKGISTTLETFRPGDHIVFAYQVNGPVPEDTDPFAMLATIDGLFKTQFDTRAMIENAKSLYDDGNIMPLDYYDQIKNK